MLIKRVVDSEIDNVENNVEKNSDIKDENNNEQIFDKNDNNINKNIISNNNNNKSKYDQELKWLNIIGIGIFHLLAVYSILTYPYFPNKKTFIWLFFMGLTARFGVTAGAHRFWTHRTFKAKLPLKIILAISYATSGMNPLFEWVRDHRIHHKYSETDADPHNSSRGFFFSHVGWLMMKKHPEVMKKGRVIDMSDIVNDPVAEFSRKFFIPLYLLFNMIIPVCVPIYFWNESWLNSIKLLFFIRYMLILNGTWSVNSVAHIWGDKPYDKLIAPVENHFVSFITGGEGWHNYHHTFPWDYKAAEYGFKFDTTTHIINFFSKIGWAYDLKQASPEIIKSVIARKKANIIDEKEY